MLERLTSDNLQSANHGFFTRAGGMSTGLHAGLNCGRGSNDDPAAVSENRNLVAQEMGVASDKLIGVHQCHSADVVTVTGPLGDAPKADAMVTNVEGLALGILTADCQPVLFHDASAGVIGAAHAGWKGANAGVLENTIDAMTALGAVRENIHAAIGPCISQRAYEVGPEFFDDMISEHPDATRFFANGTGDRLQFDLPSFGLWRLRECGVGSAHWTGHCTYSDSDRFYSYRRSVHDSRADYGRLIACIAL